jgi:LAGLIDADG DNA endonuclease family protein
MFFNKKNKNIINRKFTCSSRNFSISSKNQLGYYLAGLIEGDGSIILRKDKKESVSPKIVFTFGKNETPMFEKLKEILNTGVIYIESGGVCRYSITN